MPTEDWGLYEQGLTTGTEVSSTFEGRHITATAAEFNHGDVLGVVTKGYPVIFGVNAGNRGVGVAFNTEVLGTDLIAVDTEGIWNLTVLATDDDAGAGGVVSAGDPLFINTTTALISKIRNLVTQIPFGYALGGIAQDLSRVIAVKVHWDPEEQQDEFILWAADNAVDWGKSFRIRDNTTLATGYPMGVGIRYDQLGVKTGDTTPAALGIESYITAAVPAFDEFSIYRENITAITIGRLTAIEIYLGNRGNAVTSQYDIMIGRNSDAVLTGPGNDAYIYFREHSTVQPESSVLMLQGNNAAEYLVVFGSNPDTGQLLLETSAAASDTNFRVRCNTTAGVRWLHLHGS